MRPTPKKYERLPYRMSTYIQVVLPLVLSDLLQDGQVLLLDPVVLRLLPVHWLLLFHLVVVEVFDVLRAHTQENNNIHNQSQQRDTVIIQKHCSLCDTSENERV